MKTKVIIWGTGKQFHIHKKRVMQLINDQVIDVVGITGSNICDNIGDFQNLFIHKQEIIDCAFDVIIVMSSAYFLEIIAEAEQLGIEPNKVVSYKMLDVRHLNIDKYLRLANSDISIISNNCWGGIVYSTLGLKCNSPFKNLFLIDNEYIKVCNNLEYYMSINPETDGFEVDSHSGMTYPVLKLDDIRLFCNHDKDAEQAIDKWQRRKKHINYRNLFFEMYSSSSKAIYEFCNICGIQKHVAFTDSRNSIRRTDVENLYLTGKTELWEAVLNTAGQSTEFDLVKLLLMRDY